VCPLCRAEPRTGPDTDLDPLVRLVVLANNPWWRPEYGIGEECRRRFTKAYEETCSRHPAFARGILPILPTPVRLSASEDFRGRGVTVAFLDSGFYAHPDLVEPASRILRYVDVNDPGAGPADLRTPGESNWHGMMTSVTACGNGWRSDGLYRGLASEARVVLVKVGTARRIRHDDIRRGLDWVRRHRRRYGIRIVNVSCGGDYEASYLTDALSQAAEACARAGMLVCCAAGNRGNEPGHAVFPPASAPSVLTVGGLDDENRLAFDGYRMYHSSYGPTLDGLQKPEVIAPAIWVAAPILPDTPTAAQAALLARLSAAADDELHAVLQAHRGVDAALDGAGPLAPPLLRALVQRRLQEEKVISAAYKHVDGTSFAAPIVAGMAAQMLEAQPGLTPAQVKSLLIRTARRLPHVEIDRQGWGVVDARRAVGAASGLNS
jgi:serine protease AprX